jgi:Zn finger protein HypA/HybF involved in hydrogenase expression
MTASRLPEWCCEGCGCVAASRSAPVLCEDCGLRFSEWTLLQTCGNCGAPSYAVISDQVTRVCSTCVRRYADR